MLRVLWVSGLAASASCLTPGLCGHPALIAPKAFPALPPAVTADLEARACRIPQSYMDPAPHNVVVGSFFGPSSQDWAVLCSREGRSSILVYPAGETEGVEEIARGREDGPPLATQVAEEERFGFDRMITAVGEKYIFDRYRWYGGPEPPPIQHQGINDAVVEKASRVHYYYDGSWLVLQGAD